jgi:hypothetical protein
MPGMTRLAALLAIAASVAAIAGCGSNDVKGTIPPPNAAQLTADLDAVETARASGDCSAAATGARDFLLHVNELPSSSGLALKDALRGGADSLKTLVDQSCAAGATGATGQTSSQSSTTKHSTTGTTSTQTSTTESTTTPAEEPPSPPGNGNGNANGIGNGQGNGNSGVGNPGNGNSGGGGSTGGTGGTGIGGD